MATNAFDEYDAPAAVAEKNPFDEYDAPNPFDAYDKEEKEFDPTTPVAPVGTMPKSQFGADIPMPLDVTGVGTPDITPEPTQFQTITDPAVLRRRQAEESTWQSLSAGEKLQSDLASTARGGVETAADIVQGGGIASTKLPPVPMSDPAFGYTPQADINLAWQKERDAMTPEQRRAEVDANPIFQAGKTLREAGEKSFPTIQPESVDRPLADLGQGVASTVAFLPGALAGPGGVAVLGALAGGAGAYNEARQAGADEDKAENAFWINALAGTSEAVPLSRIFKRLDHASGREFTKSLMEMLKSGLEEGTQEVFQTVMSNIAAEHLYDKDREFLDGIVKGGGVGFFTGLLLSSLGVRGGKQAVRDVRGHFNPAIKVANLLDESALQGSPAQTAQTEIHAATDRPEEEQFVKTDFEKPTPESPVANLTRDRSTTIKRDGKWWYRPNPLSTEVEITDPTIISSLEASSSEIQGAGKPLETVEPSNTKQPEAPELPKIRKGYRAIKIQLPDGTVIDGITNDKTWEIKGKEVVNVGRPVELNGKIKWSDGPLREGEKIVEQPKEPAAEPDESQMDYGEGGEMPHTPGTWEQPKPKDTFEQFLEKQRERKVVTDRVKALELWRAGESGVVELSSNERSNRKLIVSPDVQEIGKWRVTSFDEKGPIGHHVFDSREAALRAALGEHHTDMVKGPTYHSPGEYKVSRVKPEKTTLNEREGGEMPKTPATSFEVPEAKAAAPIDEMPLEGSPEYTALPHYARRYVTEYARNKKVIESGKLASGKKASKKTIAELEKRQKQLIRNYKVSLKPKKGKHPVKAKAEARPNDFITEVLRVGKIKLKRFAGKSDAYNDINGRAHQAYRDLLLSHTTELFDKNGKTPDQIMRALVGEGNFKAEDYDTFWKKLTDASEARRAYQKGQTKQQITDKFYSHIAKANKRVSRKRVEPKATSQLAVGDKFKMQDVLFEVTAIDKPGTENPEIQLSSEKFGVQRLPEGETLMVDKNSFKESGYKPETDDEGNTLFRKKKNVADQFELPGQEGVFNLAGEKVEEVKPPEQKKTEEVPPEQEELFSTQHKDIFKRAFEGDEAAFDILDELLRDAYPDDAALHFGRGDPNTVRTAAAFEKLFEDAFKARDFDKILDAIKATSDVSIWKPLLQKFFKAQKTGDKIAALKADWMRAVFNGTRPEGALPPKAPKPPPKASTTPPRPAQPPPGGGQRPPPGPPPAPPPRRIEPTGITTGPLKSQYRIIKDFSRAIGHALRVRRQRFGVLGTYHPGSTLTTLRFAGDLDTAAHELAGHWTDDRYGIGRPWMNQRGPSPYDAELAKFWIHGSYRPTMPRRLARAEGIAEYIRAYVVNPDAARLAAPNFTVYFENPANLPPAALKAIKDFSNDVRRWYGANPLEQGRLNFRMNPPGLTEKLWGVLRGEGYGFFITPVDRLRQAFDDSLHYSMKGYRAAKKIQGKNLNPEHDFEIIARLLPSHDARFSDQLQHGLIDYRARQIMRADGKLEVSRPHDPVTNQPMSLPWLLGNFDRSSSKAFETEMLDTSAYMVHQRALEKAQQLGRTENITGMSAGMYPGGDVEVANRFFREIANDPAYRAKLAENARRYRLWADHNLQMLLDAGRITPAQFNRIKANNTQYVTMNRLSEEFDIKHGGKSSRAVGTAKQPLDRFKGSTLEINNVYSNLLEQTDAIQKEAFRNGAMQAYVESLVHNRRLNEPDRKNLQEFGHISNSTEPHTIKVYRNGKTEYWKFDKHIYENLKGLTELGIQVPWLLRAIPMFSRYMITHAPSFLLRNPTRDTFQRSVVSNNGSKPWDILRGYSQADLSRMNIFGGGQFGNYIIDKHVWNRELNRVARELVKDPRNILFSPLKLKHAWEELAKKSESVGRIGEFRRAFDVGKSRGYDDYNAALYASAEARGLLDFAKAGTAMRVINQLIPFSNARIRGLARSAFQIKEHPGRFALNWGSMVLAPTLLTMLWNRKDKETWEEYQQLPAYRKDFFWNFKIGHHWLIIPRPHELGVMAGGVERAINRMLGDKHAMEGYGMSVGNALLPVQDPVEITGPLRTGLELYFNRDSFRGHDIVPSWEKEWNLNLREGTKHASTIGQNLGKILQSTGMGADPRQVDYFLNSLGGWGQMATTVTSPTRTMGEFAAKSTGYSADVPSSTARDVQWDLTFAKQNNLTQLEQIKKLKLLREDVLNEKDPAIRDRKAKVLRDYATALRTGLEKMGPLKQKLPAKVR